MCRRIIVEEVSTVSGTQQETMALVIRVKELLYILHIIHQFERMCQFSDKCQSTGKHCKTEKVIKKLKIFL